jgi:hypothetical protein
VPSRVVPLTTTTTRLLGEAAAAFLAKPDLAASTRRSYQHTLGRLEHELGTDQPLATLTADQLTAVVTGAWGGRAPATWNRHVATVRSFLGFCRRRRWLADDLAVDLERRPEPADRTKAIHLPALERLWRRDDLGVREKARGASCTRLPPAPLRPFQSTSRTSTSTTSACGCAPRAAILTGFTSRPAPRGCYHG